MATSQVVNLLHYRSLNIGQVPANLEFGQFAVNTYNGINPTLPNLREVYLFVGTGGDDRVAEDGVDLTADATIAGGLAGEALVNGKGWVRFNLRSMKLSGDTMYGDLIISGAKIRFESGSTGNAELILPDQTVAVSATLAGSIRYNTLSSKLEVWDGAVWASTGRIEFQSVAAAPTTKANGDALVPGDQWYDSTGPSLYFWDGTAWISFATLI